MWKDQVVGQQPILTSLLQSIEQDTLSHAMIIEGPSGYGGLPIALSVAQRLLCQQPTGTDACGTCKSCVQSEQLKHPDLHFAFPVVKKEGTERKNTTARDFLPQWREQVLGHPYLTYNDWIRSIAKTSTNGDINTKECNDVVQQLTFQSFSGGKKIQIIWIADYLGNNGNKLLKLIEEPPTNTFLFMICDDLNAMLLTIRSRCRIIRMPRVDEGDMSQALIAQEVDPEMAQQVAYISDGDYSQALAYALLESPNLMHLVSQWIDICSRKDAQGMRQFASDFHRYNSEEKRAILNYVLKVLQAVLYHNHVGPDAIKMSPSDKQMLLQQQQLLSLSIDQIQKASEIVSNVIRLNQRFVNGRMVMFDASLQMSKLLT